MIREAVNPPTDIAVTQTGTQLPMQHPISCFDITLKTLLTHSTGVGCHAEKCKLIENEILPHCQSWMSPMFDNISIEPSLIKHCLKDQIYSEYRMVCISSFVLDGQ